MALNPHFALGVIITWELCAQDTQDTTQSHLLKLIKYVLKQMTWCISLGAKFKI